MTTVTFAPSRVTLLTEAEWGYLSANYEYDMEVTVTKLPKEVANDHLNGQEDRSPKQQPSEVVVSAASVQFNYVFKPQSCCECLHQKELSKMQFENKKIFIRQIDEDNLTTTPISSSVIKAAMEAKDDDEESSQTVSLCGHLFRAGNGC